MKVILPEGWTASNEDFDVYAPAYRSIVENTCYSEATTITVKAPEKVGAHSQILFLISEHGRYSVEAMSVVLLNRPAEQICVYPEHFANYPIK